MDNHEGTKNSLRPTSDKLRETLFNILAPRIEGARVVDGYAGTGAIGIEALSRGAAHVTFIERNRRAAALIEENLEACGVPYDTENVSAALDAAARHLAGDGLIVLERATRREPEESNALRRVRDVQSGDSTLTFYAIRDL